MTARNTLRTLLAAAITAASLAIGASGATANRVDPPGHPDGNHCIFITDVDLNELTGVPEQFQHHYCEADLSAGEHWRPFTVWITENGADSVYPPGYVPSRPEPVDDFVSKLTVKVVTDGGTRHEKTYVISPASAVRTDLRFDRLEGDPEAPPLRMAVTMPKMKPLSVGEHTFEVTWVLSAEHCDGAFAEVELSCLPAGELPIDGGQFTVTKPAN